MSDSYKSRSSLKVGGQVYEYWNLGALPQAKVARLPYSLKILLENLLRFEDGVNVTRRDIDALLIENRSDPRIFSPEEKQSRLARLTFFEGFSAQELREIGKAAQWQRVPAGAVIAGEGASETAFFLLLEGEVSQRIGDLRLHTLEVGEGFGEMEYLAGGGRSASYLAERECLLLSLERDFREWASLPCQLRLGKAFQSLLIRRLRDTTRDLARALRDG